MSINYFQQKTILITGATSGIGEALALQFSSLGARLILVGRNKDKLIAMQQVLRDAGLAPEIYAIDLANMAQRAEWLDKMSESDTPIDILINNAGISQRGLASETLEEVDRAIMEINFFAPVIITKALYSRLLRSNDAVVVNLSSVVGTFGFPLRSAYAASKHAIEAFFDSWMLENRQRNVRFLTVVPGRIKTAISYAALQADGQKHNVLDLGQAKGISAESCARQIINAIRRKKRRVVIAKGEKVLLFLHRYCKVLFIYLVRKLKLK